MFLRHAIDGACCWQRGICVNFGAPFVWYTFHRCLLAACSLCNEAQTPAEKKCLIVIGFSGGKRASFYLKICLITIITSIFAKKNKKNKLPKPLKTLSYVNP